MSIPYIISIAAPIIMLLSVIAANYQRGDINFKNPTDDH